MNKAATFLTQLEYSVLLPGLARLPVGLGGSFAALRGRLQAALHRDWRSFSHIDPDVDLRTCMAIERLLPHATADERAHLRQERYRAQAVEEWTAELLASERLPTGPAPKIHPGPTIYITAHFGASIEAASRIGNQRPALLMTSDIVERPGIPTAICQHYQRKYAALRHCHAEAGLAPFVRELREGGSIIILSDLPGDKDNHTIVSTPWGEARLAAGPRRLAERTGAALIPYVAALTPDARLQIGMGEPVYPQAQPDWHQAAYTDLIERIKHHPEQWWAMDLLPLWFMH